MSDTFKKVLIEVRDKMLSEMEENGFFLDREILHEPLPWDINNNGFCEEFALSVYEKMTGIKYDFIMDYVNDENSNINLILQYPHIWIKYEGKHYDAECLDGVSNPRDLPFFGDNPRPNPNKEETKMKRIIDKKLDLAQNIKICNKRVVEAEEAYKVFNYMVEIILRDCYLKEISFNITIKHEATIKRIDEFARNLGFRMKKEVTYKELSARFAIIQDE